MADKYLLQVSAGPEYDASTHSTVQVNGSKPMHINSADMQVNLSLRINNYRGLPKGSPKTSAYFSNPPHEKDMYSIAFSFIPKESINANDLVFGNDFDHPIRESLPPGFGAAFKIVKWAIDPGLDGDPYADEPYLYGPALSSLNVFSIGDKAEKLPDVETVPDAALVEGAEGSGEEVREKSGMPADAAARKKYFLDETHRKAFEFEAGRVYATDFFNPYLDFNDFTLRLPGFTLSIINYWEKKPMKEHSLRYVLKNKKTGKLYFVVVLTLLKKEEIERNAAHAEAETKEKKDGEGAFDIDDDDEGVD